MLLAEIGEHFLQSFSCKEDAAFHCPYGDAHLVRDFSVFVSVDEHCERLSELFGKGIDEFSYFFGVVGSFRRLEARILWQA